MKVLPQSELTMPGSIPHLLCKHLISREEITRLAERLEEFSTNKWGQKGGYILLLVLGEYWQRSGDTNSG